MTSGQYRTKRLIVTKSYLVHRSRRIEINQIAEVNQPKNNPAIIVTGLLFGIGTFAFFDGNLVFLLFSGLVLLSGLLPPPIVNLTLTNGATHRLNLGKERSPQRAIRTIQANVRDYQSKASRARASTVPAGFNATLNPEEYVRQYVLQLLTIKFGYQPSDIGYEFPIKLGSSQKRADVVIFIPGTPQTQANIFIIVECKRADRRDDSAAQAQLESYLAACVNARYGVVATYRWRVTEKINHLGTYAYRPLSALVDANGIPRQIDYRPGQPVVAEIIPDESDDLLDDDLLAEPESRIPEFLRGNLKYALAVGGACALLFWFANGIRPVSIAVPTIAAREFPTHTPFGQQADVNTSIPPSPSFAALTAPPFVTFTPSPRADQQAVVVTTIAPLQVEASATSAATLTSMPLAVTLAPTLIPTSAPTGTLETASFGVINTNVNINVRRTPSTNANVIAVLTPGTRIEIIGENEDGSWLHIRLNGGEEGWVAARLVRLE